MSEPNAVLEAAVAYARSGWYVIPIPLGKKRPVLKRWQHLRIDEAQLANHFNGQAQNIGVLLGEASRGLVDVDLDTPEAIHVADDVLPSTDAEFGRRSKPRSHRLFICNTPPEKVERFKDPDGTTIIELRSTGGQTVLPPSIHETGEAIEWTRSGEPIHRIEYVLATRPHIRPRAFAGTLRLYERDAVALVRHELNSIDARRGKRGSDGG